MFFVNRRRRLPLRSRLSTAITTFAFALASCSIGSDADIDDCIFYQHSMKGIKGSLVAVPDQEDGKVTITDANKTVNETVSGNETVEVNVTENVTHHSTNNVSANITPNTTKVKIESTVVKELGKSRVVDTDTETEAKSTTSNETGNMTDGETEAAEKKERSPEKVEEPFAKENVTVHKKVLNIKRRMNATHNETQDVTIEEVVKEVVVASPSHIASIYIILFVPVIVAWALYYHRGQQARDYLWLLPFTMCSMSVGQDLVNQSLTLILQAPNAITAIQAFTMSIVTGAWALSMQWEELRCDAFLPRIMRWLGVAVFFSIYQLMNHLVYAMCSLTERTVITSLAPLVVLTLENLVFASSPLKPRVTFNGKMALGLMVTGALLFSIESPSFTLRGLGIATVLLLATVPYRLAQRQFLGGGPAFPLTVLSCIDGMMLGVPAVSISFGRNGHLWTNFADFEEVSICFMMVLSIVTFVGLHVSTLAMLRLGAATTYLVFTNIASLATIALGICFFGDRALATTLSSFGLVVNVTSGLWYSAEVQCKGDVALEKLEKPETESSSKACEN